MTKSNNWKPYGVAIFSLLLSAWSLALTSNHNLLFAFFSIAGFVGAITLFFHLKAGGIILILFYAPQIFFIHAETWQFRFSPGIDFTFSLRSGDITTVGPGISINILAAIALLAVYNLCIKGTPKDYT